MSMRRVETLLDMLPQPLSIVTLNRLNGGQLPNATDLYKELLSLLLSMLLHPSL